MANPVAGKYIPSLDGLRALSAIAVVFLHTNVPFFEHGGIGVDVFFVLSGFLITSILLDWDELSLDNLRQFYVSRVRRLMPALYVVIAATLIATPFMPPWFSDTVWSAFFASSYSTNIAEAAGFPMKVLSHTWSLSVEMQFYLLWPFILMWLRNRSWKLAALLLAWCLLIAALEACTAAGISAHQLKSLHCSGLLLGAALAFVPTIPRNVGWIGAGLVATALLPLDLPSTALAQIGAALLIGSLGRGGVLDQTLSAHSLVKMGKISYGVYLWHFPIALMYDGLDWPYRTPFVLVTSVWLAAISFSTIEQRFKITDNHHIHKRVGTDQPMPTQIMPRHCLADADTGTVGSLKLSSQRGKEY